MSIFAPPDPKTPADPDPDRPATRARCSGEIADDGAKTGEARALMLGRLAATGMALVEALHDEMLAIAAVKAEPGANVRPLAELSLAYARVSRSVRQTLALEAKLEADAERRAMESAAMVPEDEVGAAERVKAKLARIAMEDLYGEDYFEDGEDEDAQPEARDREGYERPERLDADEPMSAQRPAGEVVADVCRTLGVAHDPGLWADGAPPAEASPPDASPPRVAPAERPAPDPRETWPYPAPTRPPDEAGRHTPRPHRLE